MVLQSSLTKTRDPIYFRGPPARDFFNSLLGGEWNDRVV